MRATRSTTTRRLLTILICTILLLAACSVEQTLRHPTCAGDSGSALIAAQSVATGSLLPCFEDLPAGWEIESVSVTQAGTRITIDSDRAGDSAALLRYVDACDVGTAVATPSDYEMTERFEHIHQVSPRFIADRYYQFEGGCIWWHFDFDMGVPSAMSVELGNSLLLLDRATVNDNLRASFVDEDL